MELYYYPLFRHSQKVLLAMFEKQLSFLPRVTDLHDPLQRRAFAELQPLCRLPLLISNDGRQLPESSIIVEYLDQLVDVGSKLLPDEAPQQLQVRLYDRLIDNYLSYPLLQLEQQLRLPKELQQPLLQRQLENRIHTLLAQLEQQLEQHHWLCGESFTMADCALIPSLAALPTRFNLLDFPELGSYWLHAQLRGSWMLVQDEVEQLLQLQQNGQRTS